MKNKIGTIGIIIALVAVTIAIFQEKIRIENAPVEAGITTRVINKGAEIIGLKNKASNKASSEYYDSVSYSYIGLGLLALILGIVSYLQKENHRFSGMAGALGIIAIGWEYVLIGIVIAVVIFILANLDIDF